MSSALSGKRTFFYHSFPRKPHQQDYSLGLKILDSILEKGLLLTAEFRKFPALEELAEETFIQQRVCFTALTLDDSLGGHAETFGSFSLEFDQAVIRNFGALPAVYFSGRLPSGELLNDSGESLARHLLEAYRDLKSLYELQAKDAALATAVLAEIHPSKIPIQKLGYALQAVLNLYYPTDDSKWTGPLGYYHQREWKIIPNFAFDNKWHYEKLTAEQRSNLLDINPKFFGADIADKQRVDYCLCFSDVGGKNVIDSIRRIIVPDEVVNDAQNSVSRRGRKIEVVPASSVK